MPGGLWTAERRALTAGLALTVTFVAAEALAVVTVMPLVARDLGGLQLYGWAFSAFMLGTIVGIVAAGRAADARGPLLPYLSGLVLFVIGLTVAGLAPAMLVLVLGRVLQGIGAGAIPAVAYVAIGRSLPESLRARMMALLSTAWVAPGLAGPAISAAVAHAFGWRWVFLGLLPFVAVTGAFAIPALARLGPPPQRGTGSQQRLTDGVAVAAAIGLLLAGLTLAVRPGHALAGAGLAAAGAAIALPMLRRLLPPGALLARPGLPVTVLARGLLTFAFFGADAYVTLSITTVRHHGTLLAGLAVTGSTLTWTAGAWIQARLAARWPGRRLIRLGLIGILAGMAGMTLVLHPQVPATAAIAAWSVAGLGMGMAYAPTTLLTLREAPPGREGWASASLNVADVLGSALGIGFGGAAVAAAPSGSLADGVTIAFGIAAAGAFAALAVTRRLPAGPTALPAEPVSAGPAETGPAATGRQQPETVASPG
ncbi:MAG TPA: MFS transporter [Streptosporangiaceae bacterium]